MVGRTVSIDSSHTESSSDSSLANAVAEYNSIGGGGTSSTGQNSTGAGGIGTSRKHRYELRASCPESLLLQHNHVLSRLRGHKMHPPRSSDGRSSVQYQLSCDKKPNRHSSMSVDSNDSVLEDSRRFFQENYHCSFCPNEEPTFEKLISHIEAAHPWYDLRVHRKIR
ncbi:hypothetical protein H4R20_006557 [Coemansia guatemalensis]|uniref:Uncharacterized protein n=1 Tax=Coemansia guatemalensis TaxID=2761395 RepID=A0A9W8HVN3_9FUNG|nr:hypothetical protein H4R20_006557 [Coemansia guatemalensis]